MTLKEFGKKFFGDCLTRENTAYIEQLISALELSANNDTFSFTIKGNRGAGTSTWASAIFPLWVASENKVKCVMLDTRSSFFNKQFLKDIYNVINSDNYKKEYGENIVDRWTNQDNILFKNGSTIINGYFKEDYEGIVITDNADDKELKVWRKR